MCLAMALAGRVAVPVSVWFGLRLWTMMQLLWLVGQGKCGEI